MIDNNANSGGEAKRRTGRNQQKKEGGERVQTVSSDKGQDVTQRPDGLALGPAGGGFRNLGGQGRTLSGAPINLGIRTRRLRNR
jgi:hypothetical protein